MKKNKIYISGRITGLNPKEYIYNFRQREIKLRCERIKSGYRKYDIVINPLNITPLFWIKSWFFFMVSDIFQLVVFCNSIYMLKNWKQSRGAKIEHFIAKLLKYTIRYE